MVVDYGEVVVGVVVVGGGCGVCGARLWWRVVDVEVVVDCGKVVVGCGSCGWWAGCGGGLWVVGCGGRGG